MRPSAREEILFLQMRNCKCKVHSRDDVNTLGATDFEESELLR